MKRITMPLSTAVVGVEEVILVRRSEYFTKDPSVKVDLNDAYQSGEQIEIEFPLAPMHEEDPVFMVGCVSALRMEGDTMHVIFDISRPSTSN